VEEFGLVLVSPVLSFFTSQVQTNCVRCWARYFTEQDSAPSLACALRKHDRMRAAVRSVRPNFSKLLIWHTGAVSRGVPRGLKSGRSYCFAL
jgi:hypothetical protein